MRGNLDPLRELPPAYPPERAPCTYSQVMLRKVLFLQSHIQEAALDSCGVAFNSGALGALCWFLATQEGDEVSEGFAVVLHMASMFAEEILANFMFFPAFLLLGLLTFIVNRWQVSHICLSGPLSVVLILYSPNSHPNLTLTLYLTLTLTYL